MEDKDILNFFFEVGHLRRIAHEGWKLAGVDTPDSVAEHSLRAAQIAYVLARMEGYPHPCEVCTMVVFHDIGEARIGDIHRVANRYVVADEARAVQEQVARLGPLSAELFELWRQVDDHDTPAGVIAKDADMLEQAVMAREYQAHGYPAVCDWLRNIAAALRTASARQLLATLETVNPEDWWQGLKKHL